MKNTTNNITELVVILDKSGSMYPMTEDVIGGFNSILTEQKEKENTCLLTLVEFNDEHEIIIDRKDVNEVNEISKKDYAAKGTTALIDTLGFSINHIETIHHYIRKEDVPAHTIFMIMTDGLENASHRYSSKEVKKKIEQKKELGWEFVFLAANIDAVETAKSFGIDEKEAVDYVNDAKGLRMAFRAINKKVMAVEKCVTDDSWRKELDKDTAERNQ